MKKRYWILGAFALTGGLSLIIGLGSQANGPVGVPTAQREDPTNDTTKQALWVAHSQEGLKNHLKDPDSAKFKNVFFSKLSGSPVACGEVNSKNALGGYVGYQRFVAAGTSLAVLEIEVSDFGNLWKKVCRK